MEHVMELPSAKAVFDLYVLLSDDDKCAFVRLLGQHSTAEAAVLHMTNLSRQQHARFSELMFPYFVETAYPLLLQSACRVARDQPNLTGTDFAIAVDRSVKEVMHEYDRIIGEREAAKLKEQRDRKSDPEIIRRNVQICNRRKGDAKKWTQGRLSREYQLDKKTIRDILRDELKWRQMAARLPKEGGGSSSPSPTSPGDN